MPAENLFNEVSLPFRPGLPVNYCGPVLPGAVCFAARSGIARLVIQEYAGEGYTIRLLSGTFLKMMVTGGVMHNPGLYGCFMQQGGVRKEITDVGKFHVKQEHDLAVYSQGVATSLTRFEKNNDFRLLDVYFHPNLLEEVVCCFPEIKELLNRTDTFVLRDGVSRTSSSMKELCSRLLDVPYNEAICPFYFDLAVREMLCKVLAGRYRWKPGSFVYTPADAVQYHRTREILKSHVATRPLFLQSLSSGVTANPFELEAGFRQYFNTGLFEQLLEEKMQEARKLLLNTELPVGEISSLAGYARVARFITDFRCRFGVAPASLRRRQ